jgi:homocysteine S-methyltransferase
LIKLIKQNFNTGIDHAGVDIGQPTSFFVGCALNLIPKNPDEEIKNLRRKLKAGVDFILSQPVFQPGLAEDFLQRYQDTWTGGKPVLAGVLPLYNYRHATFEQRGLASPSRIAAVSHQAEAGDDKRRSAQEVRIALRADRSDAAWARGLPDAAVQPLRPGGRDHREV